MRQLIIISVVSALALLSCGGGEPGGERYTDSIASDVAASAPTIDALLTSQRDANAWDKHRDDAPDSGCIPLKLKAIGPLRAAFNDSNYVQLAEAKTYGIAPISNLQSIWEARRPLVRLRSCPEYFVNEMTHSYPYLVPEAAALLRRIGSDFNKALADQGGGNYRIKVTSALRTPATVQRLRRVNSNATEESAHQYGTTFDISFSKFIYDKPGVGRTFEDLKNLLAVVIYDLRAQGLCYVKYEVRQSCFHITAIHSQTLSYGYR